MKKTIYLGIALSVAAMTGLVSCQADMDSPGLQVPEASIQPTISLLELKTAYEGKYNQLIYDPASWKLDEEGNIIGGDPVVVHGRVISSDASGNIYKSLVIQDETAALAFSINQGSLYNEYRLGQDVVVDLTGMYIGYYSDLQQIGYPDEPYNGTPQLGFMPLDYWTKASQVNGLPDPEFKMVSLGDQYPKDKYYMISFADFNELNNATVPELQSQLVEFRNVHFEIEAGAETFAPYQESVNRTLKDINGQSLTVRNSGYSNFYYKEIPTGTGRVRGILSYYNGAYQLVLRDYADVIISDNGTQEKPYSVEQILSGQETGMIGWCEGYIVGSVKAGVSQVQGNDDVIFGDDADLDNNVLIAQAADITDVSKCVAVELPQGTLLRYYGNLADNPGVLGKKLALKGTIGTFMGMPAVIDCKGSKDEFTIDGKSMADLDAAPDPAGSGTESDPYNVSYVIQSTGDLKDVWVEGYIAGYVADGNFGDGNEEFSANDVGNSNNYANQTNIILSAMQPPRCGVKNSVPVQLASAVKPVLGLKDNPGNFGKKVKLKCTIKDYIGARGLRSITEVKFE